MQYRTYECSQANNSDGHPSDSQIHLIQKFYLFHIQRKYNETYHLGSLNDNAKLKNCQTKKLYVLLNRKKKITLFHLKRSWLSIII